ncbi:MAG: D-2-hydroxyacid dehydrogenase [Mesorhizobium amorphae]|nr:MAG: D-2-hydroxyacid dehydrogenase [Mesorhizobium amorphae]
MTDSVRRPTVVLSTDQPDVPLAILHETHPDLTVLACDTYAALPDTIARSGAEVVYSNYFDRSQPFPHAVLVDSATVRWISVGGSGTDHLQPWDPTRLAVTNAAGVAAGMMAEYALGAMLSFSLDLPGFAQARRERRWNGSAKVEPIEGKTVLVLGLGHTGEAVAQRCKAMGMHVDGVRANPKPTAHVDTVHGMDALPGLWGQADFIVCAVPLLASTRSLVSQAAFAAMKPTAVLIDVSRGGVVEEEPLVRALAERRIQGAALDVFASEPLPADHPLWGLENVILTPHCSSVYDGWEEKAVRMFAENLSRYCNGAPLANLVDPRRGY